MRDPFVQELAALINRHSKENGSDTPDFLLAEHLAHILDVTQETIRARDKWSRPPPTQIGPAPAGPHVELVGAQTASTRNLVVALRLGLNVHAETAARAADVIDKQADDIDRLNELLKQAILKEEEARAITAQVLGTAVAAETAARKAIEVLTIDTSKALGLAYERARKIVENPEGMPSKAAPVGKEIW